MGEIFFRPARGPGEDRNIPICTSDWSGYFSGILVKATGQLVFEFADENLFSPLEIHVEGDLMFKSKEEQLAFNESIDTSGWVRDSLGIHTAG